MSNQAPERQPETPPGTPGVNEPVEAQAIEPVGAFADGPIKGDIVNVTHQKPKPKAAAHASPVKRSAKHK